MRLTNFIAGCIVLTLIFLPLKSSLASIGEVTQLEGNGVIDIKDGDSAGHTYIHTHTGSIADVDITQSGVYDNMITLTTSGDNHNIDIIQRD